MRILVYGGGFNPPHLGHLAALETARDALRPDLSLIIPDGMPPHKLLPALSPKPEERLKLCRLAFSGLEQTRVLDLAALRDGEEDHEILSMLAAHHGRAAAEGAASEIVAGLKDFSRSYGRYVSARRRIAEEIAREKCR